MNRTLVLAAGVLACALAALSAQPFDSQRLNTETARGAITKITKITKICGFVGLLIAGLRDLRELCDLREWPCARGGTTGA